MKYIVTGGAGFIGSHLVERLLFLGHDVVVVDNLSTGYEEYLPKDSKLTFLKLDISNWTELSKNFGYFKNADGLFHLAACARIQPSIYNPSLTHDTNVGGTLNILEMMRMCDISSIVYSASSSAYGIDPVTPSHETASIDCQTPYAVSKYMGELYCETWTKLHGINSTRLRYFNVWGVRSPVDGPYAPVISKFCKQALNGEPITVVGDGSQKRDFTHVSDVVDANIKAMCLMETGCAIPRLFNIGTGKNYTILDIAKKIQSLVPNTEIVFTPERIGEAKTSRANNFEATKDLKWEPKTFIDEKSLENLISYYENW